MKHVSNWCYKKSRDLGKYKKNFFFELYKLYIQINSINHDFLKCDHTRPIYNISIGSSWKGQEIP